MAKTTTPSTRITNATQKASFKEGIEALNVIVRMFADIGIKIDPQTDMSGLDLKSITERWAQLYDMNLKSGPKTKKAETEAKIAEEQKITETLMSDTLPTNNPADVTKSLGNMGGIPEEDLSMAGQKIQQGGLPSWTAPQWF